jgi:putative Mg2+ transporter-C (MgtC) family protein
MLSTSATLIKLLIAAVLGGLIGIERSKESHSPAGLRTNMVISMSSCLFTVLMLRFVHAGHEDTTMLAHVISGVGFLGAGAIFRQEGGRTAGLTTAATIWLVAGIGMAAGMGEMVLALFVTGVTLCVLHFLEPLSKWFEHHKEIEHAVRAQPLRAARKSKRQAR